MAERGSKFALITRLFLPQQRAFCCLFVFHGKKYVDENLINYENVLDVPEVNILSTYFDNEMVYFEVYNFLTNFVVN